MNNITIWIENLFIKCTGFTYSNMARLFLRLFVGVMFMQFGIRHLMQYDELCHSFPAILGMSHSCSLTLMIVIEIVCSLFIMVGFLTRIAVLPPIISMFIAEYYILHDIIPDIFPHSIQDTQPGFLPIMFIGIYLFLILAGPGKISLDYFISLFIISRRDKDEDEELEEV
ncbi:MAG: DoxX family protein [Muribaculaceae bacterium]|nr:DoxX family protein [Muribaculaceae bacterium]